MARSQPHLSAHLQTPEDGALGRRTPATQDGLTHRTPRPPQPQRRQPRSPGCHGNAFSRSPIGEASEGWGFSHLARVLFAGFRRYEPLRVGPPAVPNFPGSLLASPSAWPGCDGGSRPRRYPRAGWPVKWHPEDSECIARSRRATAAPCPQPLPGLQGPSILSPAPPTYPTVDRFPPLYYLHGPVAEPSASQDHPCALSHS